MANELRRKRRKNVCYHEAGHAVARVLMLGQATRTVIRADGMSGGSMGTGLPFNAGHDDVLAYMLAGPVAEARVSKVSFVLVVLSGGGKRDYAEARQCAAEHPYRTESEALSHGERQAREICTDYWHAIAEAAHELQRSGTLSAARLKAIVRRAES